MKDIWLSILRDKNSSRKDFRQAAHKLAQNIAMDCGTFLERTSEVLFTPFQETVGVSLAAPVLISVLKGGVALLPAFLDTYPDAAVGFLGIKRDEVSFEPSLYLVDLPKISKESVVFLLDPMLATGHCAALAIQVLLESGVEISSIVVVSILSSGVAIAYLSSLYPDLRISVAQTDPHLNPSMCIVPGIGDFGSRYFGS